MTTNYDPIAEPYKRAKQQPWRAHVAAFTFERLIGDPAGKAVIDIACGEGFYTRKIRQRGATKVTGVDLSEQMIRLAQAAEAQQRLGIDYMVGDGRDLRVSADYDLAIAAYLLNYAHDRAELNAMCCGDRALPEAGWVVRDREQQSGLDFSQGAVLSQIRVRSIPRWPAPRRGTNHLDVLPRGRPS